MLGMKESVTNILDHLIAAYQRLVHCLDSWEPKAVEGESRRREVIYHFKRRGLQWGVEASIITKILPMLTIQSTSNNRLWTNVNTFPKHEWQPPFDHPTADDKKSWSTVSSPATKITLAKRTCDITSRSLTIVFGRPWAWKYYQRRVLPQKQPYRGELTPRGGILG